MLRQYFARMGRFFVLGAGLVGLVLGFQNCGKAFAPQETGAPDLQASSRSVSSENNLILSHARNIPDRFAEPFTKSLFNESSLGLMSDASVSGELDFGGMYGHASGGIIYPNPATGGASCPAGFSSTPLLGTSGLDFPVYLCSRPHTATSESVLDFGGLYGYAAGGIVYPNPTTLAASCPSGYLSTPMLGTSGTDYPIYLCYRKHVAGQLGILRFGGAYGLNSIGHYPNPATGQANCPAGFQVNPALGSVGLDFPLYFCHQPAVAGAACQFGQVRVPHGGSVPAYKLPKVPSSLSCQLETRVCSNGSLSGSNGFASCYVEEISAGTGGGSGSCSVEGVSIADGQSKKLYLVSKVSPGDSCEEAGVSQMRKCTNGQLSGSAAFAKASCTVASSPIQNKARLAEFLPYVWSTPWYPYFNNTVGVDPDRGFALLQAEIQAIKAQGFNTLWIGGTAIWKVLQPKAGEWDEVQFKKFVRLLDLLKEKNMRAIYQFNYIGPNFSPEGIDGCTWFSSPTQVKKFTEFATELVGRLESYNSMIYYMVYSEQYRHCLISENLPYYYRGYKIINASHSESVPENAEPYISYHYADVHKVNNYLKASIGRFTKSMPKAIRNQFFVGMHDATVSDGQITDDSPMESPSDFDYFSFAFYPQELEVKNHSNYDYVINALDTRLNRVRALHPTIPVLMGEFGWTAYEGNFGALQHSPRRNEAHLAMLDWALTKKIGFNIWGWLPRYLDDPSLEANPYEEGHQLRMRNGELSSVLDVIRAKLVGLF